MSASDSPRYLVPVVLPRWLVVAGDAYYTGSGSADWRGLFHSLEEAKDFGAKLPEAMKSDGYVRIVDLQVTLAELQTPRRVRPSFGDVGYPGAAWAWLMGRWKAVE